MLVPLIVVIIIIIGLVIVQMKDNKLATTGNTPADLMKFDRVKDIVNILENEENISPSTTGNIETAKKIIAHTEIKNAAVIINAVKYQAIQKRVDLAENVIETREKLKKLDLEMDGNKVIIQNKIDNVAKINATLEKVRRELEEVEIEKMEKVRMLEEEMRVKKIQADAKIQAVKQAADQAKKDKAERAAAFRVKMAKYTEDKLNMQKKMEEDKLKTERARALEIALKNKANRLEAEAEMKRILDEQRIKNEELAESERVKMEAAEEARQVQIEENNEKMEEAKRKREEEEAKTAEAKAELEELTQFQLGEVEKLRVFENERLSVIEAKRLEAEAEASKILEDAKVRQTEMDLENETIRLEQETRIQELEEDLANETNEANDEFRSNQIAYETLQEELIAQEAAYLEAAVDEASLTSQSYEAEIAANEATYNDTFAANAAISAANATELADRTNAIQSDADDELSIARERERMLSGEVETETEARNRLVAECRAVHGENALICKSVVGGTGGIFRGPVYPWEFFASGTPEHAAALSKYRDEIANCDPKWYRESKDMNACKVEKARRGQLAIQLETAIAARDAIDRKALQNYKQKWRKTENVEVSTWVPGDGSRYVFKHNKQSGFKTVSSDDLGDLRVKASLESCLKHCRAMDDCLGVSINKDRTECTGLSGHISGYWPERPPYGEPTPGNSEKLDYFAKDSNGGAGSNPWISEKFGGYIGSETLQFELDRQNATPPPPPAMFVTSIEPGINFRSCKVFPTDLHVKSHPPPGLAGAIH